MEGSVTDWFPAEVKPVREGWYDCKSTHPVGFRGARWWWDGSAWRYSRHEPRIFNQEREWRGLAAPATHTTEGGSNA